jgi:hypothetical protein
MNGTFRRLLRRLHRNRSVRYTWQIKDGRLRRTMVRYYLLRLPWWDVLLHRFCLSDIDALHDHPWNSVSIVLRGGYWEIRQDGRRWCRTGSVLFRRARDFHRIELLPGTEGRVWTFVVTGRRVRQWGFIVGPHQRWVAASDYSYAAGLRIRTDNDFAIVGRVFPRLANGTSRPSTICADADR